MVFVFGLALAIYFNPQNLWHFEEKEEKFNPIGLLGKEGKLSKNFTFAEELNKNYKCCESALIPRSEHKWNNKIKHVL